MDRGSIAKMYYSSVQNDSIDASVLTKIPELVTCSDWKAVEIVGGLDYVSPRTKIVYNGYLVRYGGGMYYIRRKVAEALGDIDKRFKSVRRLIMVIS
jgi:hypothetical protein